MHNGRLFPQLVDRWASPDMDPKYFAPLRVHATIGTVDHFGGINTNNIDTLTGVVDPTTGVITWDAFPITIGIYVGWVFTFEQDACGPPETRKWSWFLNRGADKLWGEIFFTEFPSFDDRLWRPFGSNVFPRTTLSIGPLASYTIQQMGSVQYF